MIAEARVALSKINLHEMLVTAESLPQFNAHMTQLAAMADGGKADEYAADVIASVEKMYGYGPSSSSEKPFIFNDGVAVIPVHGVLLNRFNSCWGFVTGYNFIRAQMNAADADPDVDLIVFDDNSPGGDKAGCFELTAEIRALATKTLAVIDDTACSGGYAIAAACDRVVAVPSAQVGSIGVYRLHCDVSGANAQAGVKYTFVFAGSHKVDGNPYEALPDNVRADWQAKVDKSREEFIADIAIGRDMSAESVRETEAQVYTADEALALGLLDAVSTPTQAVSSFLAELGDCEPDEDEDEEMALPKTDAELAAMIEAAKAEALGGVDKASIAQEAVAADKARRTAILALDEAKDKQKLALTLADTDGMTAETAKVILASAAAEKADTGGNALRDAMDKAGGAGVHADADGGTLDNEGKPTDEQVSNSLIAHIPAARRLVAVK